METIISYIDNLFRNYPDAPQVRRAREELLGIMEDKYHELKAEGKSENEAIGIVISEFGSMDEIAFELGLDKELAANQKKDEDSRSEKHLTSDQAWDYILSQRQFGRKIAAGVALCICSPTLPCIMDALKEIGLLPEVMAEAIGACGLFLMVAAAVAIFITAGMANGKYESYKKCRIVLDFSAKNRIAEQYEIFNQSFGAKIAAGVVLCIVSVIPPIFTEAIFENMSSDGIRNLFGLSLFLFVAVAVALFITAGIQKDAYEVLLEKGEFTSAKPSNDQEKKLTKAIAAIYWPLITAIYLGWSFTSFNWGFTWVIWPIAGIIFPGISTFVSLICGEN